MEFKFFSWVYREGIGHGRTGLECISDGIYGWDGNTSPVFQHGVVMED
jgi:hypothetical protein